MDTSLSDLMLQVQSHGANLRVADGHVDLRGNVPSDLLSTLVSRRAELISYLTYDQEVAYKLLRTARAYISERYILGAELNDDLFDHLIDQAMAQEDMWALRTAVRRWVLAWIKAIGQAPQQHRYLKLEVEKWLEVDKDARAWVAKLPERSERYLREQLWQVIRELEDRRALVANKEILAIVLMEAAKEIGKQEAA